MMKIEFDDYAPMNETIVRVERDGRTVYWGCIVFASHRFGFNVQQVLEKLDQDGTVTLTTADPLDKSKEAVYVLFNGELT